LKGWPPPAFFLFLENATTLQRVFSVASYSVNASHFVPRLTSALKQSRQRLKFL
jgi:hypothetical protein